ncbi:hypothetical protein GCM10011517_21500 [Actibacterium pelagium]|uniref:Uncharacterized protein n=1 Tax=Actibacterium pelagium TaxID=2029103 RepID=A0A917AI84_9RHOB|nr:hypothetical protein GCM10011517_21500 [Actibacterium pelagium]
MIQLQVRADPKLGEYLRDRRCLTDDQDYTDFIVEKDSKSQMLPASETERIYSSPGVIGP